jgi:glycosyltransferase involved in cell wall biosynthesis
VLVPSRAEPFGNTALEAQLAGRPVVASAVQGLQEIVTDGETGLLVPPDDPVALAAAIATLLDDPERARAMALAGHRSAQANFSLDRYRSAITDAVARTAAR